MATVSIAGGSITLRPIGIGRYLGAVFLTVWLCGWALGELFALGLLILLVRSVMGSVAGWSWPVPGGDWFTGGAAGLMFLVVLMWLALWTFGGVAALTELLRSLAGEDRVAVASAGLELERRAGPFRRLRNVERATIRTASSRRAPPSCSGSASGRSRARVSRSRSRPTATATITTH